MNLDFKKASCFGFSHPKSQCWLQLADQALKTGWLHSKADAFGSNFAKNVLDADQSLASIFFFDIDSDTEYLCSFDAEKLMWKLLIPGSPYSAVSDEEKKAFEQQDLFKRSAARAAAIIHSAAEIVQTQILPKVRAGEFLQVDEAALETVLELASRKDVLDAIVAAKIS